MGERPVLFGDGASLSKYNSRGRPELHRGFHDHDPGSKFLQIPPCSGSTSTMTAPKRSLLAYRAAARRPQLYLARTLQHAASSLQVAPGNKERRQSKIFYSADEAVADIKSGSTILSGGTRQTSLRTLLELRLTRVPYQDLVCVGSPTR